MLVAHAGIGERGAQLRRAVTASTVGTIIEWYDFLLYGQMAAIVFAKLYFPSSDPLTGTLQAFAVFAVDFLRRRKDYEVSRERS